mmetsp:Transcript_114649/g.297133  ORF Transcript_114649/g.297133 Transcript_114649/m.297133 type:complete len:105 (-) Transcript_114649:222-536(-)
MMQQMMSDPARMQQSMAMAQQMFGGGMGNGMMGGNPLQQAMPGANNAATDDALLPMQRARYAGQLSQLTTMGFTNEAMCLRALVQHDGRVDAAIDALLANGDSS